MPAPPTPIPLHYESHGPATGRPVVLLHGFPFDGRMWKGTVPALATHGFRVLVPDLRGFGKSPVAEPASMEAMARDVAKLLEDLKLRRAVVVGFSMGGYVALQLVLRERELLSGLVLSDTRPDADLEEAKAGRRKLIEGLKARGMEAAVEAMLPKLVSPKSAKAYLAVPDFLATLMREQDAKGAAAAVAGMMERPDMRGKLSGMNIPCLVLAGEQDEITPMDGAMRMAQAFRGSEFFMVPDAGHAAPVEQPDVFNRALLEWLKRLG
jgi:pimeloyl-ACP methyl ester carboxylesterase